MFVLIPTKLAELYLKDNLKSLLYFGDLDLDHVPLAN